MKECPDLGIVSSKGSAGVKEAAETGANLREFDGKRTSGPEGHAHSIALMPGLKPRPTSKASFSAVKPVAFEESSFRSL